MENVRKRKDVKLITITTEARRNYLVSEPNSESYNKKIFR